MGDGIVGRPLRKYRPGRGFNHGQNGHFSDSIANNLLIVYLRRLPVFHARQYQSGWAPTVLIKNNHFGCTSAKA
jgi:hypothetical protein